MTRAAFATAATVLLSGCSAFEPPPTGTATLRYALRLRDGGSGKATVRYLLPDGQSHEDTVTLPWTGPATTFGDGAVLSIVAKTDAGVTSPLLCVLEAVAPDRGAWVLGNVTQSRFDPPGGNQLATCATEYRLGAWPPIEDDPETGNGLIRVG